MLVRKSARFAEVSIWSYPLSFPQRPSAAHSTSPGSNPPKCSFDIFLTLHSSLRARRGQKSHGAHHKILKRLIRHLPSLALIRREVWYLGCRYLFYTSEGRFECWSLVVFTGCSLDDVGFVTPLLGCTC